MGSNKDRLASYHPKAEALADAHASWSGGFVHIYDCNPVRRYEKHRIPGAASIDPGRYAADELPEERSARLLFYCLEPRCSASLSAAKRAMEMGYANAAYMPEGIEGWIGAGFPVVEGSDQ